MYKRKNGFTLIECIIYIFIGIVITSISLKILVNTSICYKNLVDNSQNINDVENAFINIDRLFKDKNIKRIVSNNNKIEVYVANEREDAFENPYFKKEEILKEDKNLIVKYYYVFNGEDYKTKNVLIEDIADFKILKKGKLKYLLIIKDKKEYIKCL